MKILALRNIMTFWGIIFISSTQAQLANAPWPMFRHDAQHTGFSWSYAGPSAPSLKWSYFAGDQLESSPTVGGD